MTLVLGKALRSALITMALLLSGCTGMRLIDTQVNSFAPQAVAPGSSYQFERLPSQMANPVHQARLEKLAGQALGKVGLRRQNNAPLTVHVTAVERQENKVNPSGVGIGWGMGWVFGCGAPSASAAGVGCFRLIS